MHLVVSLVYALAGPSVRFISLFPSFGGSWVLPRASVVAFTYTCIFSVEARTLIDVTASQGFPALDDAGVPKTFLRYLNADRVAMDAA